MTQKAMTQDAAQRLERLAHIVQNHDLTHVERTLRDHGLNLKNAMWEIAHRPVDCALPDSYLGELRARAGTVREHLQQAETADTALVASLLVAVGEFVQFRFGKPLFLNANATQKAA